MRFNIPDDEPEEFNDDFEDPIDMIPDHVRKIIDQKIYELSSNLSARQTFFKEKVGKMGEITNEDTSSLALVERLAFYETIIDALLRRMDNIEKRIGGTKSDSENN